MEGFGIWGYRFWDLSGWFVDDVMGFGNGVSLGSERLVYFVRRITLGHAGLSLGVDDGFWYLGVQILRSGGLVLGLRSVIGFRHVINFGLVC